MRSSRSALRAALLCATLTFVPGVVLAGDAPAPAAQQDFLASHLDTSVDPADDFFQYANGGYVENLVIPADRTRYGSFDLLSQLSENRLKALVEGFSGDASLAAGTDEAKIRDLYNSYMDEAAVEALDAQPLEPILAGIRGIADHDAMAAYMGSTMGAPGDSMPSYPFGPISGPS